jgi:hypothetical protein
VFKKDLPSWASYHRPYLFDLCGFYYFVGFGTQKRREGPWYFWQCLNFALKIGVKKVDFNGYVSASPTIWLVRAGILFAFFALALKCLFLPFRQKATPKVSKPRLIPNSLPDSPLSYNVGESISLERPLFDNIRHIIVFVCYIMHKVREICMIWGEELSETSLNITLNISLKSSNWLYVLYGCVGMGVYCVCTYLCMCVSVCVSVYVGLYVLIWILSLCLSLSLSPHTHTRTHTNTHSHTHTHIHTHKMSITYEDALSTLEAMFGTTWTKDELGELLRHQKGHMERTCEVS